MLISTAWIVIFLLYIIHTVMTKNTLDSVDFETEKVRTGFSPPSDYFGGLCLITENYNKIGRRQSVLAGTSILILMMFYFSEYTEGNLINIIFLTINGVIVTFLIGSFIEGIKQWFYPTPQEVIDGNL